MEKGKQGMIENAVGAQNEAGGSVTRTLMLKGEAIGRYVNEPLVPGLTFGWSSAALHAVAYARTTDGHLAIFDFDKVPVDVQGTKAVLLPAWSPDGTQHRLLAEDRPTRLSCCRSLESRILDRFKVRTIHVRLHQSCKRRG